MDFGSRIKFTAASNSAIELKTATSENAIPFNSNAAEQILIEYSISKTTTSGIKDNKVTLAVINLPSQGRCVTKYCTVFNRREDSSSAGTDKAKSAIKCKVLNSIVN